MRELGESGGAGGINSMFNRELILHGIGMVSIVGNGLMNLLIFKEGTMNVNVDATTTTLMHTRAQTTPNRTDLT